jgi:hypothetical protein
MRVAVNRLAFLAAVSTLMGQETNSAHPDTVRNYADHQLFSRGPYTAFMDPFNKGSYISGKDFTETFAVDADQFPSRTTIQWNWPVRYPKNVLGFLQIAGFGDYFNTTPQTPIQPKRLKDISRLTVFHDLTYFGTDNGYDIIYDYFLTETPHGANKHLFEIEIFLHTPAYSVKYFERSTPVGLFSGSGVLWKVAIDRTVVPPDILFMPTDERDLSKQTIDLVAMHSYLISKGIIEDSEYYNGHSLGVEPAQGFGTMLVTSASVDYQ